MKLHRLRVAHLAMIALQPAQAALRMDLTEKAMVGLAASGGIAIVDRGEVLLCAGLVPQWPGRWVAWALLSGTIGPRRFVALNRLVEAALDRYALHHPGRIEIQVDPHHRNARRWARLLGFAPEGRLHRYLPDGRDMILMARIT